MLRRPALLAALAVALLAAPALAEHGWKPSVASRQNPLQIEVGHTVVVLPGEAKDLPVVARHRCPAPSEPARFDVSKNRPVWLNATIANASWSGCRDDGFVYATTTLRATLSRDARAGPVALAYSVLAIDGRNISSQATAADLRVAYEGRAELSGPKEGALLPASAYTLRLTVNVTSNGPTLLRFAHEVPRNWRVESPAGASVPRAGEEHADWALRITPPVGASGDHRLRFMATPVDDATREAEGASSTWTFVARLPPPPSRTTSSDAPATTAPPPVPVAPTTPQERGFELPVWGYGVLMVAAAVAALAWAVARR